MYLVFPFPPEKAQIRDSHEIISTALPSRLEYSLISMEWGFGH